jgi:hypothetical protein
VDRNQRGRGRELSRTQAILELVGVGSKDQDIHDPAQAKELRKGDIISTYHQVQREKDSTEDKELARPEANRNEPDKSAEKIVEIVLEL